MLCDRCVCAPVHWRKLTVNMASKNFKCDDFVIKTKLTNGNIFNKLWLFQKSFIWMDVFYFELDALRIPLISCQLLLLIVIIITFFFILMFICSSFLCLAQCTGTQCSNGSLFVHSFVPSFSHIFLTESFTLSLPVLCIYFCCVCTFY